MGIHCDVCLAFVAWESAKGRGGIRGRERTCVAVAGGTGELRYGLCTPVLAIS